MDDTPCRDFFLRPTHPYQRRYEAFRAVFVEGRAPNEVATQFGFTDHSLRQLLCEFRQYCGNPAAASPFFET